MTENFLGTITINCCDGSLQYPLIILKVISEFFHDLDESIDTVTIPFTLNSLKTVMEVINNRLKCIDTNIYENKNICELYSLQNYLVLKPPLMAFNSQLLKMIKTDDEFQLILDHTPISTIIDNEQIILETYLNPPGPIRPIKQYFRKYIRENKPHTGRFIYGGYNWSLIYAWCLADSGYPATEVIKIITGKLHLGIEVIICYAKKIILHYNSDPEIKKTIYNALVSKNEAKYEISLAIFSS